MSNSFDIDRLYQLAYDYIHPETEVDEASILSQLIKEQEYAFTKHYSAVCSYLADETGVMLRPLKYNAHERHLSDCATPETPMNALFLARQDVLMDVVFASPDKHHYITTWDCDETEEHAEELLANIRHDMHACWCLEDNCITYFAKGHLREDYQNQLYSNIKSSSSHDMSPHVIRSVTDFLRLKSLHDIYQTELRYRLCNKDLRDTTNPLFIDCAGDVSRDITLNPSALGEFRMSNPAYQKNPDRPDLDFPFRLPMD